MTNPGAPAVVEPCPFCGKALYRSPRPHNPKAYCVTEDCYGKRMSVVNLDDPIIVAMWNTRASAVQGEPVAWMVEREGDPTFPRLYDDEADAMTIVAYVNVNPPATIRPLYAHPAIRTPDNACEYCGNGRQTGLPGNACENCMNTGLKYPPAVGAMDREYDPNVAPCDDAEFGMKP